MNTMVNENGLTFKDFEKKTFEMICELGRKYTREFLECYDVYLNESVAGKAHQAWEYYAGL